MVAMRKEESVLRFELSKKPPEVLSEECKTL